MSTIMSIGQTPNLEKSALEFVGKKGIDGLKLSGGDEWQVYPIRDETETLLFQWAQKRKFPVLGVCRGFQVIQRCTGGKITAKNDHIHRAARHILHLSDRLTNQEYHGFDNPFRPTHANLLITEQIYC
jgi:gamma-glutamyl-gamma-aminobutyrate hydrolase PuuD